MPSTRETFGLVTFASRVPAVFVRKNMRSYILGVIDPQGSKVSANDEFVTTVATFRRKPDAVAIVDVDVATQMRLPAKKHILFVEVEFSAPITEQALADYADLYDLAQDDGSEYSVALAVVDHYGCHRFVDLGGVFVACAFLRSGGIGSAEVFDAFKVRTEGG